MNFNIDEMLRKFEVSEPYRDAIVKIFADPRITDGFDLGQIHHMYRDLGVDFTITYFSELGKS